MISAQQRNRAVGVTIAAVVIVVASFLPWGEIRGGADTLSGAIFQGLGLSLTVTAWNGHITLLGIKLPNWLVVVTAVAAAALVWIRAAKAWEPPHALLYALAGYGLFHSAWVLLVLMFSNEGSAGIGSLATAAAFVGMLVALRRLLRVEAAPADSGPSPAIGE